MKNGAFHEDLQRELKVTGSSDRAFGLVIAGFFALVGMWPVLRGSSLRPWPLGAAAVFLVVALACPRVLAALNRWWTGLGLLLQRIVSPVVLGLLFYLVVTPTGALMRLLGKRPLRLGFDRGVRSYWIERRPPGPAPDTMPHQF